MWTQGISSKGLWFFFLCEDLFSKPVTEIQTKTQGHLWLKAMRDIFSNHLLPMCDFGVELMVI